MVEVILFCVVVVGVSALGIWKSRDPEETEEEKKAKGYACVEMKKMEDAIRSVDILQNQPFMGRNLLVSGANERQEQPLSLIHIWPRGRPCRPCRGPC